MTQTAAAPVPRSETLRSLLHEASELLETPAPAQSTPEFYEWLEGLEPLGAHPLRARILRIASEPLRTQLGQEARAAEAQDARSKRWSNLWFVTTAEGHTPRKGVWVGVTLGVALAGLGMFFFAQKNKNPGGSLPKFGVSSSVVNTPVPPPANGLRIAPGSGAAATPVPFKTSTPLKPGVPAERAVPAALPENTAAPRYSASGGGSSPAAPTALPPMQRIAPTYRTQDSYAAPSPRVLSAPTSSPSRLPGSQYALPRYQAVGGTAPGRVRLPSSIPILRRGQIGAAGRTSQLPAAQPTAPLQAYQQAPQVPAGDRPSGVYSRGSSQDSAQGASYSAQNTPSQADSQGNPAGLRPGQAPGTSSSVYSAPARTAEESREAQTSSAASAPVSAYRAGSPSGEAPASSAYRAAAPTEAAPSSPYRAETPAADSASSGYRAAATEAAPSSAYRAASPSSAASSSVAVSAADDRPTSVYRRGDNTSSGPGGASVYNRPAEMVASSSAWSANAPQGQEAAQPVGGAPAALSDTPGMASVYRRAETQPQVNAQNSAPATPALPSSFQNTPVAAAPVAPAPTPQPAPAAVAPQPSGPKYTLGQQINAKLVTKLILTDALTAPVVAKSDDGTVWVGLAQFDATRRVQVRFSRASVAGNEQAVSAVGYSADGTLGLGAQIQQAAPDLAGDLLRSGLSGVTNYVQGLASSRTVQSSAGGNLISSIAPGLGEQIASSIASAFGGSPQAGKSMVVLGSVASGTPIVLLYGL